MKSKKLIKEFNTAIKAINEEINELEKKKMSWHLYEGAFYDSLDRWKIRKSILELLRDNVLYSDKDEGYYPIMVDKEGFESSRDEPIDLQSTHFNHLDTYPHN